MNSDDGQVYSVCILQFSCFTKYNRMQSNYKQTKCEHSRRNSYRLQLSQQVFKELFKKMISNSSLHSHVYWDTLYYFFNSFNIFMCRVIQNEPSLIFYKFAHVTLREKMLELSQDPQQPICYSSKLREQGESGTHKNVEQEDDCIVLDKQ